MQKGAPTPKIGIIKIICRANVQPFFREILKIKFHNNIKLKIK